MKVGILGGAFDPVHIGHLLVAQDALERLKLDRVLFVLAARPPHKNTVLPYADRRRLLRAALKGHPNFELSEIELRVPGPTYTVDTLAEFRRELPGDRLFLLIGADQYAELSTWKEPKVLGRYARLVVMTRPGAEIRKGLPAATAIPVRKIELSSTEIRCRIGRSQTVQDMVPEPALKLIRQKKLYSGPTIRSPRRQDRTLLARSEIPEPKPPQRLKG